MRARTGLWEPRVGNDPGPPGPNRVAPISLRASVQSTACMDFFWSPCIYNHYEESCPDAMFLLRVTCYQSSRTEYGSAQLDRNRPLQRHHPYSDPTPQAYCSVESKLRMDDRRVASIQVVTSGPAGGGEKAGQLHDGLFMRNHVLRGYPDGNSLRFSG
jgi:hypothetical protein